LIGPRQSVPYCHLPPVKHGCHDTIVEPWSFAVRITCHYEINEAALKFTYFDLPTSAARHIVLRQMADYYISRDLLPDMRHLSDSMERPWTFSRSAIWIVRLMVRVLSHQRDAFTDCILES